MPINQPSNQIKLTNVSLVRLKKGKKRYELACYKNKLLEYRSGTETDLDNVLQIPTVFLSVSKGQTAPSAELTKSFGKDTPMNEIIQEILKKGEVQVGEKERKDLLERVEREVVDIVSGKLVDPGSKRPYTTGMISKALDQLSKAGGGGGPSAGTDAPKSAAGSGTATPTTANGGSALDNSDIIKKPTWTGVVTTKSAKSQALEAMKALIAWQPIPVMRARMRLRVTCPTSVLKLSAKLAPAATLSEAIDAPAPAPASSKGGKGGKGGKKGKGSKHDDDDDIEDGAAPMAKGTVKDRILSYVEQVETQDVLGEEWELVGFSDPGAFKGLSEFVGGETKGRGRVEVLDMAVMHED